MASRAADRNPRTLHDPLQTLRIRRLCQAAGVSVYDVRCRPWDFARGAEEWARMPQVVFPRRGVFAVEARGRELIADANHALLFQSDEPYRVSHPAGCGDDCTVLAFDEQLAREVIAERDPAAAESAQFFRSAQVACDESVFWWQSRLHQAALQGRLDALDLEEGALQLLRALLASDDRRGVGASPCRVREGTARLHAEQVQRASLLLATRFGEGLSLSAIARAAHCSPFHLARIFRAHFGLTLHQYRHRLRLREALRRLAVPHLARGRRLLPRAAGGKATSGRWHSSSDSPATAT
ncbi:MAG TPA: AraC family transcriptional regulator [Polyangiaceae bacterium]|nr:AraC family transcriptional regulator [Polyangiaceae bacterium]